MKKKHPEIVRRDLPRTLCRTRSWSPRSTGEDVDGDREQLQAAPAGVEKVNLRQEDGEAGSCSVARIFEVLLRARDR